MNHRPHRPLRRTTTRWTATAVGALLLAGSMVVATAAGGGAARPDAKSPPQLVTAKQVSQAFGNDVTKVAIRFGGSIDTTPEAVAATCSRSDLNSTRCYFASKATNPRTDAPEQTITVLCGMTEGARKIQVKKSAFDLDSQTAAYTPHYTETVDGLATGPTYVLADNTYISAGFRVKGKGSPKKGTPCLVSVETAPSLANLQGTKNLVRAVAAGASGKKPPSPAALQEGGPLLTETEVSAAIGTPIATKPSPQSTCDLLTLGCSFSSNTDPNMTSSDDTSIQVSCGQQQWGANQFDPPAVPVDVGEQAEAGGSYGSTRVVFLPYQSAPTSPDAEAFVCTLDYQPGGSNAATAIEPATAVAALFNDHLVEQAIPLKLGES